MSARRSEFGASWWARAWRGALEGRAQLDPNRLPRGRTYARHNRVEGLRIVPGEIQARVSGSRATPYRVRIRVRQFTDAEWDRVLDAIGSRAGHAAALLDGELTPGVADDVRAVGLDLLPGPGELGPRCSCPDWADPCKHAAAVCYLAATLLDADPFDLLLLRGRPRDALLAALRSRRSASSATHDQPAAAAAKARRSEPDQAIGARQAYLARPPGREPPLPAVPRPPEGPGWPVPLGLDPPPGSGVDAQALLHLAVDAAGRAWELATGEGGGGLDLDRDADLARRAAAVLGTPELDSLARGAGMSAAELARLGIAWRHGGAGAVAVLRGDWTPPPELLDEGRQAIAASGARVRASANRVSAVGAGVQLRLGEDGLWYRLERRAGTWEIASAPHPDPAALVADGVSAVG